MFPETFTEIRPHTRPAWIVESQTLDLQVTPTKGNYMITTIVEVRHPKR